MKYGSFLIRIQQISDSCNNYMYAALLVCGGYYCQITIDSKFTYFGANLLKHVLRFGLLRGLDQALVVASTNSLQSK